jgi:hypothetical protein
MAAESYAAEVLRRLALTDPAIRTTRYVPNASEVMKKLTGYGA